MMVNLPCLMESCSNFLRPTCSYTECRLSFLTGSCPMEGTTASYSSCLYLILPTLTFLQGTDIQWTLCLVFPFVGLVADIMHKASLSLSGFFPEPCSDPELSDPPARLWNNTVCLFRYATCLFCCSGLFISAKSFFGSYMIPFFRVVKITRNNLHAITISDCIFFNGFSPLVV